ncbi:hypothetical protein TWF730_006657 [Orbilia blumenaviensis]|uniref:Carbohydrate kinase PfkB domain-containing protein n=1 Tax=Orbilia blumenaviensis TaxID=1796055 RepID=A0AAV9VHV8_9PEZI
MSLLRASGLRCHIRPLRISQVARRSSPVSLSRLYSDDAAASSSPADELEKNMCRFHKSLPRKEIPKIYFNSVAPGLVSISEDVLAAMKERKPILGLETAIYTHGFPKPDNYNLALEMEETVRENGAVPATIGILNGKIFVGMTNEQLKELTESAGSETTHKISRRDIAYHLGSSGTRLNGGTTIAGTILLATMAGIRIIATGGLGGVHKGGENSLDISADLTELSRNSVAVVTSGMKSFLDTPRTMEFLETQGVFVSTFGNKTDRVDIPGFFSRESGYPSPYIVEGPEEAARIFFSSQRLGLTSGSLYFNPIPEEFEIPKSEIDPIIAAAVEKSSSITGKDNTPAVLAEIVKQTEGRSMEANRHLVLNNARIGARMATEMSRLDAMLMGNWPDKPKYYKKNKPRAKGKDSKKDPSAKKTEASASTGTDSISSKGTNGILRTTTLKQQTTSTLPSNQRGFSSVSWQRSNVKVVSDEPQSKPEVIPVVEEDTLPPQDDNTPSIEIAENPDVDNPGIEDPVTDALPETGGILVIGGVGIDVVARGAAKELIDRTSNPGTVTYSVGGVAKNVAATIRQLDPPGPVKFLSIVGRDLNGIAIIQELQRLGISVEDIKVTELEDQRTACYAALNSASVKGGLSAAVADMDITKLISEDDITTTIEKYQPQIVCFDGNLSQDRIRQICKTAKAQGALVVCEPTSVPKAKTITQTITELALEIENPVDMISPNYEELKGIWERARKAQEEMRKETPEEQRLLSNAKKFQDLLSLHQHTLSRLVHQIHRIPKKVPRLLFEVPPMTTFQACVGKAIGLLHLIPTIIVKFGSEGVLVVRTLKHPDPVEGATKSRYTLYHNIRDDRKHHGHTPREIRVSVDCFIPVELYDPKDQIIGVHIFWAPAVKQLSEESIVSSNGAGDTFLGAFLHSMVQRSNWLPANIIASPWAYLHGEQLGILVHKAQMAAVRTLLSNESHPVRSRKSLELIKKTQHEEMWAHVTGRSGKIIEEVVAFEAGNMSQRKSVPAKYTFTTTKFAESDSTTPNARK